MSIATLKKKTRTQYNNMSVGSKTGFSLNGTHRSQGYVGQTMLSRSLPRTIMKGSVAKGYGGCCGFFPIQPIVQSAVTSLNDPNVVKTSVINTMGMIDTKYRWVHCAVVKPDNNQNLNTQRAYIANVAKNAIKDNCHIDKTVTDIPNKCANFDMYHKKISCVYTKPESYYVAKSASEHLTDLNTICTKDDVFKIPTNMNRTPFVGNT